MNEFRYEKQIILKGFGMPAQQLLQNSKVLIVGVGGLGTPCAQYLNGAGVGTIDSWLNVKNIPLTELHTRQSEIDFHIPVITICEIGVRSKNAALLLKNNDNPRQVFSLQGGLQSLLSI